MQFHKIHECYLSLVCGISQHRQRKKLEAYKGQLWTMIENLKDNLQEENSEFILTYVKDKILPILDPTYQEIYLIFFKYFQQLWDQLYEMICIHEINNIERDIFNDKKAFSVAIDELTKKSNLQDNYYNNYQKLFKYEKNLTNLIPDSPKYYFLDSHLDIVTKSLGIKYEKISYQDLNIHIYSFLTNSRIEKIEEQYLKQINRELEQGTRMSEYINNERTRMSEYINNEIKDYIIKHLLPYHESRPKLRK